MSQTFTFLAHSGGAYNLLSVFRLSYTFLWSRSLSVQLEFERARAERLERERQAASGQAQEDLAQQQQLSSALAKECQRASARAQEESQRVAQLCEQLEEQRSTVQVLRGELEAEQSRGQQTEARAERQLAEFDTEREQLKLRLRKEEKRSKELQDLIESLRKELEEIKEREKEWRAKEEQKKVNEAPAKAPLAAVACQTETDGKVATAESAQRPRFNGYLLRKESDTSVEEKSTENGGMENGGGTVSSPVHLQQSLSPSGTACSSLSSSPCSSPVLAKRLASLGSCSPTYPSSYQASVNQRFQAARHKFQQQAEQEQQQPHSPRDLSPTTTPPPPPEHSTAKQIARNTVTQVKAFPNTKKNTHRMSICSLWISTFGHLVRKLCFSFEQEIMKHTLATKRINCHSDLFCKCNRRQRSE